MRPVVAISPPAVPIFVLTSHADPAAPWDVRVETLQVIGVRTILEQRQGIRAPVWEADHELLVVCPELGHQPVTPSEIEGMTGMVVEVVVGTDADDLIAARERAGRRAYDASRGAGAVPA